MRLIDADELLKWISGQIKSPSCPKNESAFGLRIMKHVDRMPSVQPEIIRCKDCKHWKDSDGVYRRGIGAESKCPINIWPVYDGVFYCGYAERRTDEGD